MNKIDFWNKKKNSWITEFMNNDFVIFVLVPGDVTEDIVCVVSYYYIDRLAIN